jgi:hypothetical protein
MTKKYNNPDDLIGWDGKPRIDWTGADSIKLSEQPLTYFIHQIKIGECYIGDYNEMRKTITFTDDFLEQFLQKLSDYEERKHNAERNE